VAEVFTIAAESVFQRRPPSGTVNQHTRRFDLANEGARPCD
jgi:hypothetical protein